MRSLVAVLVALPLVASAGPIDKVARVARSRERGPLTLTFQADACTLTAALESVELVVPLREVSWSMTKETDGTNDAVVTARCTKGDDCVTAGKRTSRFAFRLATDARQARAALKDLKGLVAHCATR